MRSCISLISLAPLTTCLIETQARTILPALVPVALKLFAAVSAGSHIKSLPIDAFRVGVPPCHSASIRAELLFLFARLLKQWRSTVQATSYRGCGRGRYRVASDVGLHSIQRQVQHCGNLLIAVTLTLQLFDFYRIFVPHSNASF